MDDEDMQDHHKYKHCLRWPVVEAGHTSQIVLASHYRDVYSQHGQTCKLATRPFGTAAY